MSVVAESTVPDPWNLLHSNPHFQHEQLPPFLPNSIHTMQRSAIPDTGLSPAIADVNRKPLSTTIDGEKSSTDGKLTEIAAEENAVVVGVGVGEGQEQAAPPKRKRGRPRKSQPGDDSAMAASHERVVVPTHNGPENTIEPPSILEDVVLALPRDSPLSPSRTSWEQASPPKKKRGRPRKSQPGDDGGVAAGHERVVVPMPNRSEDTTDPFLKPKNVLDLPRDSPLSPSRTSWDQASPPKKKRGRPRKSQPGDESGVTSSHEHIVLPTPNRSAPSTFKDVARDLPRNPSPSPTRTSWEQADLPKKKRGRPPKNKPTSAVASGPQLIVGPTTNRLEDTPKSLSKLKDVALDLPRDPSPLSSWKIPIKTSMTKPPADVVNKEQLAYMTPPVTFLKSEGLKSPSLPVTVRQLWINYVSPALSQRQFIPPFFKDRMFAIPNSPMSYRPEIRAEYFGFVLECHPEDYEWIWRTVVDVESMAEEYRYRSTGSHWTSVVIQPLLHLVRRLRKSQAADDSQQSLLEVIDITTTEISPTSLCPYFENSAVFKDFDKRVDCAVGLRLSEAERFILQRGQYSEGCEPSINQTSSFVNMTPMFINIEVKQFNSAKDPMIPLATWIAAEFKKRVTEEYSLDMPVLAITVVGDLWELYIAYAVPTELSQGFRCEFMGPFEMGATTDLVGIFKILNFLWRLTSWGLEEYRTWFEEEILAKYR